MSKLKFNDLPKILDWIKEPSHAGHLFIVEQTLKSVKEDSGKFKKGDILKAAGYRAPARNSARGNVLEGNYAIQWTGPLYLK